MNILNSLDTFDSGDNPNFNTGTLFDLPTGKYVQGIDGEWYLTGGLPMHITVFGGRNGHFKSTITNAYAQRITAIYPDSDLIVEDTEDSLTKDKERAYAMAEELAPKINKSNVQWLKGIDYDLDSFDKWFKDYCQNMINDAQSQIDVLISDHEVMQRAYQKANEVVEEARGQAEGILNDAYADASAIREGAIQYTDSLLQEIQGIISTHASESRTRLDQMFSSLESIYNECSENRSKLGVTGAAADTDETERTDA